MMAAPDRHLKASPTGLVKDTAVKIANADMPLYFPCPCRYVLHLTQVKFEIKSFYKSLNHLVIMEYSLSLTSLTKSLFNRL